MKVHTMITAIALDNEDVELTKQAYNSFINCPTTYVNDVMVDTRLHPKDQALTGKWNDFIDFYRNKDYDYLMICANDTIAHPDAMEYMVRLMEDNPEIGIIHPTMCRDWAVFLASCEKSLEYDSKLGFNPHETANMILRKGVIETVGEFDLLFPHERNEQDYFVRATRLGVKLGTSPMNLFYHPQHSQDDPNRQGLFTANNNFMNKFGADWFTAVEGRGYSHPFNDPEHDFTYTLQDSNEKNSKVR